MKKLLILVYLFMVTAVSAQNPVLNPGFENWSSGEPDYWTTNNIFGLANPCQQFNVPHNGSYSLRGIVMPVGGTTPYPPYITSTDASSNPIPISQFYNTMKFYYRLGLTGTAEVFTAGAVLSDVGGNGVAGGAIELNATNNTSVYTLASFPITVVGTGPVGAYITFVLSDTLSAGTGLALGSFFLVDDVELSNSTGVNELSDQLNAGLPYPNPAVRDINLPFSLKERQMVTLEIFNQLGQKVAGKNYGNMNSGSYKEVVDVSAFNAGIYHCIIHGDKGYSSSVFAVAGE